MRLPYPIRRTPRTIPRAIETQPETDRENNMTIYTGKYTGARACTSGPQPGAWGVLDWYLATYSKVGGVSDGIYNCRSVRGGRTTSVHGEGRAFDAGVRPYGAAYGNELADRIVKMSKELGVQCVIWNRKIWSCAHPHAGWRKYSGIDPHTGHLHIELTWAQARKSRSAAAKQWARVLGGSVPKTPQGASSGGSGVSYKAIKAGDLIKLYTKGETVKKWQTEGLGYTGKKADGYYGPSSQKDTKAFQKKHGLTADGIVGPKTWAKVGKSSSAKKTQKKTSTKKAPGSSLVFPLPKGYYFGPRNGGTKSVSGYHKRTFRGKQDRDHFKAWANQLIKRGWSIGKGKTYLSKSGNDGLYGNEYKTLIKAFQKDQKLTQDGLLGRSTWVAAFENPVT